MDIRVYSCVSSMKLSRGELLNVLPSYTRNWAGESRAIGLCGIARGSSLYCELTAIPSIPTVSLFNTKQTGIL